jgi:amidase
MNAKNMAVAEAYPKETIIFETKDCFSNQIQTEQDLFASVGWDTINPATGPLKVRGAEPQDVLAVKVLNIEIADRGAMVAVPDMGALGHHITHSQTKMVPIVSGHAIFSDKIDLPISPMIGVIGTSPAAEDVPNGTPGTHGGNMDTRLIAKGATLYLPVFVEGAGLAVGDLHAVMADGEVVICGVEVSGEVTVQVDLIKEKALPSPVLENEKSFYCIASAESLDKATASVLDHTLRFLKQRLPLPVNEIAMLMSIACNLQISQIVDPLRTVRMEMPKKVFERYGLCF